MENIKYYVYFIDGISHWSDNNFSDIDNNTYYEAPANCDIGTPCALIDNQVVPTPLPESEIQKIKILEEKKRYFNNFLAAINKKKNELIQTISATDRTIILGSAKTESKYYTDTWQNFYQRCQNIRFNPTLEVSDIQRTTANTIISNIDVYTEKKRLLIVHMQTLTIAQLKVFDPLAAQWWTI